MSTAELSRQEFTRLYEELGAAQLAKRLKLTVRAVYSRRKRIESELGRSIINPPAPNTTRVPVEHPGRLEMEVHNGIVLVASDCHYWPGDPSTGHRAFVHFCRQLQPSAVVLNGDVIDAATISRHAPIGWEKRPTVQQELETAADRLHEIEQASGKARKFWTMGNHDARFETRIATLAPELAKVKGVHLKDHFSPFWEPCWSVWLNDDVVIKHRMRGGIHAQHNNNLWSGKTTICGHLHSAQVRPFTDYNGTRYGVDTGSIADPDHLAFLAYTEDNPKNWRSGFAVLTFRDGRLMYPELVLVMDKDHVEFRSEIINI